MFCRNNTAVSSNKILPDGLETILVTRYVNVCVLSVYFTLPTDKQSAF